MERTVNSLRELGKAFGLKPHEPKEKVFYCRKCGTAMTHVPGTNVHLCPGKPDQPCDGRYLAKFTS